jgi:hypothetical protein
MSDDPRQSPSSREPRPSATATIIVPPRPALPVQPVAEAVPALPPGWKLASAVPEPKTRTAPTRERSATFWPRALLGGYLLVLTLIALWPVPVDSGAGPLLRAITRVFPVLTYARVEFSANIVLFVPLGVLLALILQHRHLVVPLAFLATVTIESMQALMIDKRVPSVMDIIANVAGACLGLVIVAFVEWWRRRQPGPPPGTV